MDLCFSKGIKEHYMGGNVDRRKFLSRSLATASVAGGSAWTHSALAQGGNSAGNSGAKEYYQLRKYHLVSGPQQKIAAAYFEQALIPALNRLGINPVGTFTLTIGPETPATYLLLPSSSLETLVTADMQLAKDDAFLKAAQPFWAAPAKEPAFERVESSLMVAFPGHPKLTVPPVTASKGKRIFQMRTYESPSNADHVTKVEMFNSGEYGCFERAGFWQVFYGDTLIGPRLPQLTYMLGFPDLAEMNGMWDKFQNDPEWKKLVADPRFSAEAIVSNISNLILTPTSYSQI